MHHLRPPLLTRLRRHRGLWALVVAVMLIKLATGTACLADTPAGLLASATPPSTVSTATSQVRGDVAADKAGNCLLGEGSTCHCACAETVTLPMTSPRVIARVEARFDPVAIRYGFAPATPGSLLRPPIA